MDRDETSPPEQPRFLTYKINLMKATCRVAPKYAKNFPRLRRDFTIIYCCSLLFTDLLTIFSMVQTPEIVVLAFVFHFFRACGAAFLPKLFILQAMEGATAPRIFLAPAARFSSKTIHFTSDRRRRCSSKKIVPTACFSSNNIHLQAIERHYSLYFK